MSKIRVKRIAIENFKSFKGLHILEKFKDLTAIIGPNGSGKSNFMDAICFAIAEKTSSLRMSKLADLIHGSVIGRPISTSASVTITFENTKTSENLVFQRTLQGSSSAYTFNGKVVRHSDYMKELEAIGIVTKAGNCFVFQGAVESIAVKRPKDMTQLFEEISGSAEFKQEYETLKAQVEEGQQKLKIILQRKRRLISDRAKAIKQEKALKEHLQNLNDLNKTLITHCLLKLFHGDREIKNLEKSLRDQRNELANLKASVAEAEEELKTAKKDLGKCNRNAAKIEQDIREAEVEFTKKKSQLVSAKKQVSYTQKKLDDALKTLENAKVADVAQADNVRKLEEELAKAYQIKKDCETEFLDESQSQGIQIDEELVLEYNHLKSETAKKTAQLMQELEPIIQIIRFKQDRFDNIDRLKTEAQDKFCQKEQKEKEFQRRMNVLFNVIQTSEEALVDKYNQRKDLESKVMSSRVHLESVQAQLETVIEEIGDEITNKYEEERRKKKADVVQQLQALYEGVYGRVIDLCEPVNSKYNIAFTKVFGSNMEAIIVDTEQTARRCIKYLKEQRLDRETFLPVNYVQYKPINTELRDITEPKNVYLLFELLSFAPQEITPVILYIVSNVLVCETPEDACKVAYELNERNNAVALDGTYYQKSGIISGGSVDLAKKAKRWNEKYMTQLKEQKEKLSEELKVARTNQYKESELNLLNVHIDGLETRIKYFKTDLQNTKELQLKNLIKLLRFSEEVNNYKVDITNIQQEIQEQEPKMLELETKLNNIEDGVFANFCRKAGVLNIRQYEDRELFIREKFKQKQLNLQTQIDKISNLLIFERNRATQTNVTRWTEAVEREQQKLENYTKHQQKMKDEFNTASQEVTRLKSEHTQETQECSTKKKQVDKAKQTLNNVNKKMKDVHKELVQLESKVEQAKSQKHTVLFNSKIDGLDLPLLAGSMEDIAETELSQASSQDLSGSILQYEKEAKLEFDYKELPKEFKKLVDEEEISNACDMLLKEVQSKRNLLSHAILNTKADEKLQRLVQELTQVNEAHSKIVPDVKVNNKEFARVKKQRFELFEACFLHVSSEINNVYVDFTGSEQAIATLNTINDEEPYLEGINYHCTAPGKQFQLMTNLSGGEKTLAALSLMFALQSYRPAPFLVVDEVDAALDKINTNHLIRCLQKRAQYMQIFMITLKEKCCASSKVLIGIDSKSADCIESRIVSLDYDNYEHLIEADE